MNRRRLIGFLASLLLCVFALKGANTNIWPLPTTPPGMSLPVMSATINSNFFNYINFLRTNGFGSGGGGSDATKVLIYSGGSSNQTSTNRFNLIDTHAYRYVGGILFTNQTDITDGLTPPGCGYVWLSGPQPSAGVLTNCNGKTIIDITGTYLCTNWVGPYFLYTTLPGGTKVYTNACGFERLTNTFPFACDDPAGPYFYDGDLPANTLTNACLFTITGSRPCPDSSGPYYPFMTNDDDIIIYSNICGLTAVVQLLCTNGDVFTANTMLVTNDFKINGLYHKWDAFGQVFTNKIVNATNQYITFQASNLLLHVIGGNDTRLAGDYRYWTTTAFYQTNYPYYDGGSKFTNTASPAVIQFNGTSWIMNTNAHGYFNAVAPTNATWTDSGSGAPTPTLTYTYEAGPTYYKTNVETVMAWAEYIGNDDVRFFWGTNVTFIPPGPGSPQIISIGAITEQFYLTNMSTRFLIPDTSTTYLGNGGQKVTFTTAINSNLWYVCGSGGKIGGYIFNNEGSVLITVYPPGGPPGTPPSAPPCIITTNDPSCSSSDVYFIVGCDCRKLVNAKNYQDIATFQTQAYGPGPGLVIRGDGTAKFTYWQVNQAGHALITDTVATWPDHGWSALVSPAPACAYQIGYGFFPTGQPF